MTFFNDKKQIKVNMNYKSSWCLYTGSSDVPALEPKVLNEEEDPSFFDYTPYNFSGKSFSQGSDEPARLKKFRKWIRATLSAHHFIPDEMIDTLSTLKENVGKGEKPKDFIDSIMKIESITKESPSNQTLLLRDTAGGLWTSNILQRKFPHLQEGEICLVKGARAFYLKSQKLAELQFLQKSNILKFLPFAQEAKRFEEAFT